ncbi:hypothetical protein RR42_s0592 [Cupriavidus basilensis]|uniref:Uncharacterized protein n=1 Tax=Cupriavidus basilensis TaxID=68895 RepID=A0A0C4YHV9_9BURK|nr:hypothetical protein RR42_s0592 [Cupriavidus basilensis]
MCNPAAAATLAARQCWARSATVVWVIGWGRKRFRVIFAMD